MHWLIGAGLMSEEYDKVLKGLKAEYLVIGRNENSAKTFKEKTGTNVITGGIDNFLAQNPALPETAIVSVNVDQLHPVTLKLLEYGVTKILVEKPGCLTKQQCKTLVDNSKQKNAQIFIAYNRRFFQSVLKGEEIIEKDGGILSFNFEFTEWPHLLTQYPQSQTTMEKMFLANSTHVADLAFFLGGKPKNITCYTEGKLDWHPSSSRFSGAGKTEKNALFSYSANWESPGRWGVEILTPKHRIYYRPMEKLHIQEQASVQINPVEINDELDTTYKPGLFLQVKEFFAGNTKRLCTIEEQQSMLPTYNKIAGY